MPFKDVHPIGKKPGREWRRWAPAGPQCPISALFLKFPILRPEPLFARFQTTIPASKGPFMTHVDIVMLQPLVALIFGILILILPRLLNYLIAIYLILIGLAGLFPHLFTTTTT
jgi:hypothetical protein